MRKIVAFLTYFKSHLQLKKTTKIGDPFRLSIGKLKYIANCYWLAQR
jgi:hypothetical protein